MICGCATARLGTGPDVYSLAGYPQGAHVGIVKVADARGTDNAGMIGGCGIKIKGDDLSTLATNYLLDGVNRQLCVNVVRMKETAPDAAVAAASGYGVQYMIFAKIHQLKMSSLDALMQPVEVECNLGLKVYDSSGKEILDKSFTGYYQERIGLSIVDKATGKLTERVVRDAVSNLVKDPELQGILKANNEQKP